MNGRMLHYMLNLNICTDLLRSFSSGHRNTERNCVQSLLNFLCFVAVNLQVDAVDVDVTYVKQIMTCSSSYSLYFNGVLYVVQGALLSFGAFLAWETRKVIIILVMNALTIVKQLYRDIQYNNYVHQKVCKLA